MPRKAAIEEQSYKELIERIGFSIEGGRQLAVRKINSVLVATYWSVGRWIVEFEQKGKERAIYGEGLMKKLSADLSRKFGKGWGVNQLRDIRQFYLIYREHEKHHTLCGVSTPIQGNVNYEQLEKFSSNFPLSWSNYRLLMRFELPEKKVFYEREALRGGWSFRQLDRQIQSMLYERTALSKRKTSVIEKAHAHPIIIRPEDEIKDPYVLDFLGLRDEYSESDLEDALIQHLEEFLLELGVGFAFIARQKQFEVGGNRYRIDLMLYHRIFKRLVLIDLKVGTFHHGDAGQINFYLNWAKQNAKLDGENDPIGLILCAGKNESHVEYALGGMSNQIFVSEYKLNLPKPKELRRVLQKGRDLFFERQKLSEGRPHE